MNIDQRLTETLIAQRDAVPEFSGVLQAVEQRGLRRIVLRRTSIATGAALVLAFAMTATIALTGQPAMATSPATGDSLVVLNTSPTVLRSVPGGMPANPQAPAPTGTDLSFAPIGEPSTNDLEAIGTVIEMEGFTDPVVVAIGSIEAFDTRVYMIHDTGIDSINITSAVVVDPSFPNFVSYNGPTSMQEWGPSGSRNPDGSGWVTVRVPTDAVYVQMSIGGESSYQFPSDGFVWMPFEAAPDQEIAVIGYTLDGEVFAVMTIDAIPCGTEAECKERG